MRYFWSHYEDYFGAHTAGFLKRAAGKIAAPFFRRWDKRTCDQVGQFLAISNEVADRILAFYQRDAKVVYPPVDTDFYQIGDRKRSRWALAVSALVPYKRIDLAIAACEAAGIPLKIVGDGPEKANLRTKARGTATEFLGKVPREELRRLYQTAHCLVFPGREDFGIVPVEAQACGCPVVALGRGGAAETVIDGETGLFFSEQRAESLAEALARLDRQEFCLQAIRRNAERFSCAIFEQSFRRQVERFLEAGSISVK